MSIQPSRFPEEVPLPGHSILFFFHCPDTAPPDQRMRARSSDRAPRRPSSACESRYWSGGSSPFFPQVTHVEHQPPQGREDDDTGRRKETGLSTEWVTITTVHRVRRCRARSRMLSFSRVMMSQRGKGFIQDQQLGLGHRCPGELDALLHPARKLRGKVVLASGQAQVVENLQRAAPQVVVDSPTGQLQGEEDVAEGGAPREERVVLENEGDAAGPDLEVPARGAVVPAIRLERGLSGPDGPRNVTNDPLWTVKESDSRTGFRVKENPRLFASMTDSEPMHPSFSHPDCTVGNGLSPFPLSSAFWRSPGCGLSPRVGKMSLPRRNGSQNCASNHEKVKHSQGWMARAACPCYPVRL